MMSSNVLRTLDHTDPFANILSAGGALSATLDAKFRGALRPVGVCQIHFKQCVEKDTVLQMKHLILFFTGLTSTFPVLYWVQFEKQDGD